MESTFVNAEDVAKELDISKAHAYKLIRQLNGELESKGFLTVAGRTSREYFTERFYGIRKEEK